VDAEQLAHLMIELELSVATAPTYKVKTIDEGSLTLGASWIEPWGRVCEVQELRGQPFLGTVCGALGGLMMDSGGPSPSVGLR
jgi:hypothetical protein